MTGEDTLTGCADDQLYGDVSVETLRAALSASVARAELVIAGVTLIVHTLGDGSRIIEKDGVERLFGAMADGKLTANDAIRLAVAISTGV